MNIGSAANITDLPVKTIRYYEDIGLIHPERAENGYRSYAENDLHKLRFIQRARSLGFTVQECRQLLALYEDRTRASSDVKDIAQRKMAEVDKKISELQQLKRTLGYLVEECHGDKRPDCPILDGLAHND
jgi:MerR family copper efflux transcriptional regulator